MDDQYFKEEMNYLFEQGKEFAKQHPQKARMLNAEDQKNREPNVERIIESLAFLTSRIRQRLDKDFSKIADGLLSLMWPGYIAPVPAFCLLEMRPMPDATAVRRVPRGTCFDSEPVVDEVSCRFRTCFDAHVVPIEVAAAAVSSTATGSELTLSFEVGSALDRKTLEGHTLDVQILGEFSHSWEIFDLLLGQRGRTRNVEEIEVTLFDAAGNEIGRRPLGNRAIQPLGLSRKEELLPSSRSTLWCFSLLRDFFLFPEKYQAFRLDVLAPLVLQPSTHRFDVTIRINKPWPQTVRVSKERFSINTVPIVNLFDHDANPIILNRLRHNYTVRGDIKAPQYFQIYSVDRVESIHTGSNRRTLYAPLYTARSRHAGAGDTDRYYSVERKKAAWGGWETYINFVDLSADVDLSDQETVSLSVTCTNAGLPSKLLPNQIRFPVDDVGAELAVRNITHPTAYILPDIEKISLWRWLSHAALNYASIRSAEQLRSLLTLQDFSESEANRYKIAGIKSIELETIRSLYKGALIPGVAVALTVREEHFSHRGEIQLFAHVLSAFMSAYASINSYVQLSVKLEPSELRIHIPPRIGDE